MRHIEARRLRIADRTRRIEDRHRCIEARTRHVGDRHRNGGPRKHPQQPAPPAAWLPHSPLQRPRPPQAASARPKRMHSRLEAGLFHRLSRIPKLPGVPGVPRAPGLPRVPDALAPPGVSARDDGAWRHPRAMTGPRDPRSKPAMVQRRLRRASPGRAPARTARASNLHGFACRPLSWSLPLAAWTRGQPFVKPR